MPCWNIDVCWYIPPRLLACSSDCQQKFGTYEQKKAGCWVPFCTFFGGKRQASSTKTFICVAILFIIFSRLLVRNAFGHRRECSLNCQLLEFIVSGAPVQLNIPQGSLLLLITQPARYRIFDWHSYDNPTFVYGTGLPETRDPFKVFVVRPRNEKLINRFLFLFLDIARWG